MANVGLICKDFMPLPNVSVSCFYKFQQEADPHCEQLTEMFQSQQFNKDCKLKSLLSPTAYHTASHPYL